MKYHEISATDAFIVFDLDDAPAVGVTRAARKILRDGAELLARSTTYSFASFGIKMGGGSAGINVDGDARDSAVAGFVDEVTELVVAGRWATDPGLGLTQRDVAGLRSADGRPDALWTDGLADQLTGQGAVAAAVAACGTDPGDLTAAIVGTGAVTETARAALEAAGATVAGTDLGTECDVVFLAGRTGMVDHDAAATVNAPVVVPLTPVPVTARAHAVLSAAGRIHVPDFLSVAAPLLYAHDAAGGDSVERIGAAVAGVAASGPGAWLAAVERAEDFLRTWRDELPFGRPLA